MHLQLPKPVQEGLASSGCIQSDSSIAEGQWVPKSMYIISKGLEVEEKYTEIYENTLNFMINFKS